MHPLIQLLKKKNKLAIGLMSGTSVDSIDAVLVEIAGAGISTRFRQRAFIAHPFPKGFREFVLHNSLPGSGNVETISTLNVLLAQFFADAVHAVARKARIPLSKIDLIGSHGQTVHHLPSPQNFFGTDVRSTLQLGDPSTIAKLTGIVTVGDFRPADMALGGQGAPLVPYFDFIAFRSATKHRALLNIGGIANLTVLPKNCTVNDVRAFDTGPGNMLVDALMKKLYKKDFDRGGSAALDGEILPELITTMFSEPYFAQKPPKSTGRELFGEQFIAKILNLSRGARSQDIIATATEFTPLSVYQQYVRFLQRKFPIDELVVSGGGAHNMFMMEALGRYFSPARVTTSNALGISSDAKEAICFGLLANETIAGNPSNVPAVTGASRPTVLGKICLP
ncbi:MAG: anhydro-N-acetylmuramic acid kinase [Bacteroidota bacterium]|nr:anhydro-N-acetylmuramic acid kinase [Bacteroidota bacterium]